jgi:signal peptidase I
MQFVFWSLFIWLIVRCFIMQAFKIPSASMNNTFKEGDYIFVNKVAYGSRVPITPLSFPFTDKYLDWVKLPYIRILGYTNVAQNDIVVFNFPLEDDLPIDHKKEYIKRCVGLPGDTLLIKKGVIIINNQPIAEPESILFPMDLNKKRIIIDSTNYSPIVFPNSSLIKWNSDYFGPLYIPKKGAEIELTEKNLLLYKRIIRIYENNLLEIKNDSVFINNLYSKTYIFKMNYYFTIGDNR